MSARAKSECDHGPVADLNGRVISPRVHYGDGLDGMIECLKCGKIVGRS